MEQNSGARTYLALMTAVLFWGISFVATKVALQSFTSEAYMFFRFLLAGLVFLLLLLRRGVRRLPARVHLRLFLVALFEPGFYFVFETAGLQRTSAAKAALIIATAPLVVAALSRIVLGERVSRKAALGGICSIIGVALLVLAGRDLALAGAASFLGDLFIALAVVSAAFYMLLARSVAGRADTFELTAYQIMWGAVLFLPLFLARADRMNWAAVRLESVGAVLFLVFFATIVAFFSYNYALSHITAARASVFLNGIPVVTAVTAWLVLGETLVPLQIAGGVLVVAGVSIANMRSPAARLSAKTGAPPA